VLADYARVLALRQVAARRMKPNGRRIGAIDKAIATGFAWMFSGARLPAPRLIDLALRRVQHGQHRT
jgi:hypothetical protein